jgi:hypothetical protein
MLTGEDINDLYSSWLPPPWIFFGREDATAHGVVNKILVSATASGFCELPCEPGGLLEARPQLFAKWLFTRHKSELDSDIGQRLVLEVSMDREKIRS